MKTVEQQTINGRVWQIGEPEGGERIWILGCPDLDALWAFSTRSDVVTAIHMLRVIFNDPRAVSREEDLEDRRSVRRARSVEGS